MMRRIWVGILIATLLAPTTVWADALSISAWSTGDPLNATNLNSRHTEIQDWANGNIANDNLSATAGIVGSKLDLTTGTGRIINSGGTVTTSSPSINTSQTWNKAGTVFTGILANFTCTACASESRLIDLQIGGTSVASVSRTGQFDLSPQAIASGSTGLVHGAWFNIASATYTDNLTAASGTAGNWIAYAFQAPTLAAANTSVTTTNAATVYISGAPAQSTNQTITNSYALWVAGKARFDGAVDMPLRGYIAGLTLSNDGSTPNTVIDVSAGNATDSTNAYMISLAAFTKTTAGPWAAGTGNAGMFTGAVAQNTWYHVCLIRKDADGSGDIGLDTSATCANKPAGYTYYRRIWSVKTQAASANLRNFYQIGESVQYMVPTNLLDQTNPGTDAQLITTDVPTGVKVTALIGMRLITGAAAVAMLFTDPGTTDTAPSGTVNNGYMATGSNVGFPLQVGTDTSGRIRARLSFSDGSTELILTSMGYIDSRGRFD